jgi:hypothetical protein
MDILRLTRLKTILLGGNYVIQVRAPYRQSSYKKGELIPDPKQISQLQERTMLCAAENGNIINVPTTMSKADRHAFWNFFKRIDSAVLPDIISWYTDFSALIVEKEYPFYSTTSLQMFKYNELNMTKATKLTCEKRTYNLDPDHLDVSRFDLNTLAQYPQLTAIVNSLNHLTGHLPHDIDVVWPLMASLGLDLTDVRGSIPPRLGNLE